MNDVLGQNVEIVNDIDSTAKEESKGKKLKLHDITYEKLTGLKKIFAQMDIKGEINEEVRDYGIDKDQEHLDRISVLMSQYKFLDDGIEESPELIAKRALRLSELMFDNTKLNSKIIKAMLKEARVDNVSTVDENVEEQLVDAINQENTNEEDSLSDMIQQIDDKIDELKATDNVPAIESSNDASIPVSDEFVSDSVVEEPQVNDQDFAPLFNEPPLDEPEDVVVEEAEVPAVADSEVEEEEPVVENNNENGIQPMTDEEIEESRELLRRTAPRENARRFSFEDIFGPNNDIAPVENSEKDKAEEEPVSVVNNDEEAFLEVDKLLQQADDLKSRGNRNAEEREKAEQRRKAAEDRRQQAVDDEAMKKAALADAIEKYRAYVAALEADENEALRDIEEYNAAADKDEEATRAAEKRSAYTQQVIDSLINSMENVPKKKL